MGRIRMKRRRTGFKSRKVFGKKRKPGASAIRKHNAKRKRSSIEQTVAGWLIEAGIKFKQEKPIGKCHVDFFLEPNICIETNGCYWHKCSICYPANEHKDKVIRAKDAKRYAFLRSRNMDVIVIWECEILKFPDRIRDQLRALVKDTDNVPTDR